VSSWWNFSHYTNVQALLRFAWVVDDAKCIVVRAICVCVCVCVCVSVCLSVCLSLAAFPHNCIDPDVTRRNGNSRGCPLVVHYCADLQSVHGFRSYDNIARTWNVSECLYSPVPGFTSLWRIVGRLVWCGAGFVRVEQLPGASERTASVRATARRSARHRSTARSARRRRRLARHTAGTSRQYHHTVSPMTRPGFDPATRPDPVVARCENQIPCHELQTAA